MSPDKIQFPSWVFPSWVPPDAQRICTGFYLIAEQAPFPEALEVLQRLATHLEMEDAWAELKHFAEVSPKDLMGMTFLVWLCAVHNGLHFRLARHLKSDRELASMARAITDELRTADSEDATLRELERITAFFERRDKKRELLRIAPPPKKAGYRNADEVAFVYAMCDFRQWTGRRRPYELVAILANVAFDVSTKVWTADRVKHCLRARSHKK